MLKLDAINQMLSAIGQSPSTTVDSQHPDHLAALAIFNRIDKQIQGLGWWFNMDYNLTLSHNPTTGDVIVPANTLGVDPSDPDLPYVQRGSRLFDYNKSTFNIAEDVDVDIKQLLDFDTVPETAAVYIAHKASFTIAMDLVGDQPKLKRLEDGVTETWIAIKSEDIKYRNVNIKNNPYVQYLTSGIRPTRTR